MSSFPMKEESMAIRFEMTQKIEDLQNPRILPFGEPAVYHVISRTALDGFVLGDMEKEYLLTLITLRAKWASLSDYVKEIKQGFSRWYNKRHSRKGFFWSERFKSVLVDNGDTLVNCLAYIDLNPVLARLPCADWEQG
jgi:hypothetical protein